MQWNLLGSHKVDGLPPHAQFAAYAEAYLDSAERLCRVLARSHKQATFERGVVVLFMASHAFELFLKGAILRRSPNERFGHDLDHLHKRYKALFSAKRFHLPNPFQTSYGSLSKKEISAAKVQQPDNSELFRYPRDKKYQSWGGVHGFEATSFLGVLSAVRADFTRVLHTLDG